MPSPAVNNCMVYLNGSLLAEVLDYVWTDDGLDFETSINVPAVHVVHKMSTLVLILHNGVNVEQRSFLWLSGWVPAGGFDLPYLISERFVIPQASVFKSDARKNVVYVVCDIRPSVLHGFLQDVLIKPRRYPELPRVLLVRDRSSATRLESLMLLGGLNDIRPGVNDYRDLCQALGSGRLCQ